MTGPSLQRPRLPVGADTAIRNYPLLLRRMERLMEISQIITSTLELRVLLRKIIDAACELTDTEAASIMLFDPNSGELRFEASSNWESWAGNVLAGGIAVPLEGSIAGLIVKTAQPLVVPDTANDPRWHSDVDKAISFVTRSLIGVPLLSRNETIGVLEAVNKRQGQFTDEDVITLQWLAAQAAVAIVNARLFQQTDLIAELVHELRTPLTALMATTQLLMRAELGEIQRREMVLTMQRETSRLSHMANSFLDMARLESGRAEFSLEAFDLSQLVEECVEIIQPQAGERGLEINVEMAPGLPQPVSDAGKTKQVLLNLLTNAVKYNRPGGRVQVLVEPAQDALRISVSDTGRGIPPEAMPHLFEKFYRVPDSEGYATGSGLGLRIAKRIIEALGGDIVVASTVNAGSTFSFTLPLRPDAGD